MRSRTIVLSVLLVLPALCPANPIAELYFSEFQVAPDSLERLELHFYSGQCPVDLSGARIVTRAGTAVVDSGLVLDSTNYLVIDRSNTSGTFSLADDSDFVWLIIPPETTVVNSLRYPANPNRNPVGSWRPPHGLSCALTTWSEYWPPRDEFVTVETWYVDSTPTFGMANDDDGGGISGIIYDHNGRPLTQANVVISAAHGAAQMQSAVRYYWPAGYYEEVPTGPGVFFVTASKPGYLSGCYPDSIRLNTDERRSDIHVYLYPVGLADQAVASGRARPGIFWYAGRLLIISDHAGRAHITVFDELGRLVWNSTVALHSGINRLSLHRQPGPGVYFARSQTDEEVLTAKLVTN